MTVMVTHLRSDSILCHTATHTNRECGCEVFDYARCQTECSNARARAITKETPFIFTMSHFCEKCVDRIKTWSLTNPATQTDVWSEAAHSGGSAVSKTHDVQLCSSCYEITIIVKMMVFPIQTGLSSCYSNMGTLSPTQTASIQTVGSVPSAVKGLEDIYEMPADFLAMEAPPYCTHPHE